MRHPHIAARIVGTPLLIHRAKLDVILSVLGDRIDWQLAEPSANLQKVAAALNYQGTLTSSPGIKVIPVQGTLVKRALGLAAASGLTSYADIGAMLDIAARDPAVRGILLDVDSPGGETGGVFELSEAVRAVSTVKPVWAVANDSAFSAAYAIAASAQRVIVTRTGGVGSIGVIALHVDQSVRDAQDGLRYTAITTGARKNDYSPHEPLSTEAQTRLQTEVNRLYDVFVAHVAGMRGITPDIVRATEAGLYFGPEGVAAGLADAIMSFDEALIEFTTFLTPRGRSRSPARAQSRVGCASLSQQEIDMPQTHHEAPPAPAQEPAEEIATAPETIPVDQDSVRVAEVRQDVRRETQAIAELCLLAGHPDKSAEFIAAGKTEAGVRQLLLTMKATHQSPEIRSTLDPDKSFDAKSPTSPANPLILAVKKITGKE